MNKPVHSLYNVRSTPDTRIRTVRRLRGNLGEAWGNIDMFAIRGSDLKLHRIWRTGNSRYVGIVSHWNMSRRFKVELNRDDITKLNDALHITITGSMVFSEPIEIHVRQFVGHVLRGIALIPALTFTESVQTELTPIAKQSAIETICHLDSRVTSVQASFDVMLNPTIRIECHSKHQKAIESAIAAYNDGSVAITWKLVGKPAFYGKFEKTDKIPTAVILLAGDDDSAEGKVA